MGPRGKIKNNILIKKRREIDVEVLHLYEFLGFREFFDFHEFREFLGFHEFLHSKKNPYFGKLN